MKEELKPSQEKKQIQETQFFLLSDLYLVLDLCSNIIIKLNESLQTRVSGFLCPYWHLDLDNYQTSGVVLCVVKCFPESLVSIYQMPVANQSHQKHHYCWIDSSADEDIILVSHLHKPCSKNLRWQNTFALCLCTTFTSSLQQKLKIMFQISKYS